MSETPLQIDIPQAYEAHRLDLLDQLRSNTPIDPEYLRTLNTSELTTEQADSLSNEVRLLGIDYRVDPEGFLHAHAEHLSWFETSLTEQLPAVKDRMANGVIEFLGLTSEAAEQARQILLDRSEATAQVIVRDNLLAKQGGPNATFLQAPRQITMSGRKLMNVLAEYGIGPQFKEIVIDNLLSHEVLHSQMIAGTQETFAEAHTNIRNGLRLSDISNPLNQDEAHVATYGRWVSEAVLETVRRAATGVDTGVYTPGVIIFELAEFLDPGITRQAVETAFLSGSPGALFGRLESLFGPNAIADLDESAFIADRDGIAAFKSDVLRLLDPVNQAESHVQLAKSCMRHDSALESFPK